jgi:hypothetical protein
MKEIISRPNSLRSEYKPFLIAKVSEVFVQKGNDGEKIYDIYLSRNEFVAEKGLDDNGLSVNTWLQLLTSNRNPGADFVKRQISSLDKSHPNERVQIASNEFPLRWAGAGVLLVIETPDAQKYAVVNIRHKYAFHGGKLDANGGVSDSLMDWLTPGFLGFRELTEEIILIKDETILVPSALDSNKDDPRAPELLKTAITHKKIKNVAESIVGKSFSIEEIPITEITPPSFTDFARIHFKGVQFSFRGLVIVDAEGGSLDVRNIYLAQVNTLKGLTILDGETKYDAQGNSSLQGRKILLLKWDDIRELSRNHQTSILPMVTFHNGISIEPKEQKYQLTPALSYITKSLFSN